MRGNIFDEALLLAGIADGASDDVQAGRQRGIGHDTPIPDGIDQVILADNPLPVADQVFEQVKHLWRDGEDVCPATKLTPVSVECVVVEQIAQTAILSEGLWEPGHRLQRKE